MNSGLDRVSQAGAGSGDSGLFEGGVSGGNHISRINRHTQNESLKNNS